MLKSSTTSTAVFLSSVFLIYSSVWAQQGVAPPAKVEILPLAPSIVTPPTPLPSTPLPVMPAPSAPLPQTLPTQTLQSQTIPTIVPPPNVVPLTSSPLQVAPPISPLPQTVPQQVTPAPLNPPLVPAPFIPAPPVPAQPGPALLVPPAIISPDPTNEPNILELNIEARPVLSLKDEASNEEGFTLIRRNIARLNEEAKKAGIAITGRPFAVIDLTDDQKFKFEVMLPIEKPLSNIVPAGLNFGMSPTGRAIRFKFSGAYDESAYVYESIEAYIEEKNIIAKNYAIEEYLNDPKDGNDADLQMYIYYVRE